MYCPQCGHQQPSSDMRFCSRCGLSLCLATDLLPTTGNQLQREKRELMGVGLMMATVLMLVNIFLVFGLVTLPHLSGWVFLWLWLTFLVTALSVGGVGLVNLIRDGFFKRLKERDARVRLMDMENERRTLAEEKQPAKIDDAANLTFLLEPRSVTETTTRELGPPENAYGSLTGCDNSTAVSTASATRPADRATHKAGDRLGKSKRLF